MQFHFMFMQRFQICEALSAPSADPAETPSVHFHVRPQVTGPPKFPVTNAASVVFLAEMLAVV